MESRHFRRLICVLLYAVLQVQVQVIRASDDSKRLARSDENVASTPAATRAASFGQKKGTNALWKKNSVGKWEWKGSSGNQTNKLDPDAFLLNSGVNSSLRVNVSQTGATIHKNVSLDILNNQTSGAITLSVVTPVESKQPVTKNVYIAVPATVDATAVSKSGLSEVSEQTNVTFSHTLSSPDSKQPAHNASTTNLETSATTTPSERSSLPLVRLHHAGPSEFPSAQNFSVPLLLTSSTPILSTTPVFASISKSAAVPINGTVVTTIRNAPTTSSTTVTTTATIQGAMNSSRIKATTVSSNMKPTNKVSASATIFTPPTGVSATTSTTKGQISLKKYAIDSNDNIPFEDSKNVIRRLGISLQKENELDDFANAHKRKGEKVKISHIFPENKTIVVSFDDAPPDEAAARSIEFDTMPLPDRLTDSKKSNSTKKRSDDDDVERSKTLSGSLEFTKRPQNSSGTDGQKPSESLYHSLIQPSSERAGPSLSFGLAGYDEIAYASQPLLKTVMDAVPGVTTISDAFMTAKDAVSSTGKGLLSFLPNFDFNLASLHDILSGRANVKILKQRVLG